MRRRFAGNLRRAFAYDRRMPSPVARAALAAVVASLIGPPALAQTVDERATQVQRTPATPPPNLQPGPSVPGLTSTGSPQPAGSVDGPRGTGFLDDSRGAGPPALRGAMPGLTVTRPGSDGRVSGTVNLLTDGGTPPGFAP